MRHHNPSALLLLGCSAACSKDSPPSERVDADVPAASTTANAAAGSSPASASPASAAKSDKGPARSFVESYPTSIGASLDRREAALQKALTGTPAAGAAGGAGRGAYVIVTASRWAPGHVVTIAFRGGSQQLRKRIVDAARAWTAIRDPKTNQPPSIGLDFGDPPQFREWSPQDTQFKADVRIAFSAASPDDGGFWSAIGTDSRNATVGFGPGQPSMMLDGFDDAPPLDWEAVTKHEFGHAFGFQHEHQSPAAKCGFRWDTDPAYVPLHDGGDPGKGGDPKMPLIAHDGRYPSVYQWLGGPYNGWSAPKVDSNLKSLKPSRAYQVSVPNKTSIMMYALPAILFLDPEHSDCYAPDENLTLSDADQAGFLKAYPPRLSDQVKVINDAIGVIDSVSNTSGLDADVKADLQSKRDVLKALK